MITFDEMAETLIEKIDYLKTQLDEDGEIHESRWMDDLMVMHGELLRRAELERPVEKKDDPLKQALDQMALNKEVAPVGSQWRHLKRGDLYIVTEHSIGEQLMDPMITYTKIDERYVPWTRHAEVFLDGRFERVGGTGSTD